MSVSFLIPAYNSEDRICAALESIQASAFRYGKSVKIYVSDNNSEDKTVMRVRDFVATRPAFVDSSIALQSTNLGCYGNLRFLSQACKEEWGCILCADDLLLPQAVDAINKEAISVPPNVSLICFLDQAIAQSHRVVRLANGSRMVSGRRGLALFLLFGCFVGGLSNACIRCRPQSGVLFDQEFRYFGDVNYYADLLIAGKCLFLSNASTNLRQSHSGQISSTGGIDCQHFWEAQVVVLKLINGISRQKIDFLVMTFYAHTVLFFQFYRQAGKDLINGNGRSFINLAQRHAGGSVTVAGLVAISAVMIAPIRSLVRTMYQAYLLQVLCR